MRKVCNSSISVVGDTCFETVIVSAMSFQDIKYDIDFNVKIHDFVGGAAAGVAMLIAQINRKVFLKTYIGNDRKGKCIKEKFTNLGINMDGVIEYSGNSPRCTSILQKDERKIFVDQSELPKRIIEKGEIKKWLDLTSNKYLYATCPPWAKEVVRQAKKHGKFIICDIQADYNACYHSDFIKYTDVLLFSVRKLGLDVSLELMKEIHQKYNIPIIATGSTKGCYLINNGFAVKHIPVPKVVENPCVLGLGQGDAFGAGIIVGISNGLEIEKAIHVGMAFTENMLRTGYYILNTNTLNF